VKNRKLKAESGNLKSPEVDFGSVGRLECPEHRQASIAIRLAKGAAMRGSDHLKRSGFETTGSLKGGFWI